MVRTMRNELSRFTVELLKMTTSNGSKKTVAAVPMSLGYQLKSSMINDVLPAIEREYQNMLSKMVKTENRLQVIDEFLQKTSDRAIIGLGLMKVLSDDLKISSEEVFNLLLRTTYVNSLFQNIKKEYRRVDKSDPISYAEACQQLVDIFGLINVLHLMQINGIKMKKSTLQYLYNVSRMPPIIKKMIKSGELPLTVAFMIPQADEEKQIEIANKVKNMKYSEAKKVIMHLF